MEQGSRKVLAKDWHIRAGQSHAEARKLLTTMAVGSIGVLYATVVGKDSPPLQNGDEYLAIAIVVSMVVAALFGLSAWRADAAWAYQSARYFANNKGATWDDVKKWHNVKKWCDLVQAISFAIGLAFAGWLTIGILHINGS
jgi:hypothetical protein